MWTLHFVVVRDLSPESACRQVQSLTEGFGDEDNYYDILGCISEQNQVYKNPDVLDPSAPLGYESLANINQHMLQFINDAPGEVDFERVADFFRASAEERRVLLQQWHDAGQSAHFSWRRARGYCAHQAEVCLLANPGAFNVLEDTFNEYIYDQPGVTDFSNIRRTIAPEEQRYVVLRSTHN